MSERTNRIARLVGWIVALAIIGFIVYRLVTAPAVPRPPAKAVMSAKPGTRHGVFLLTQAGPLRA